MNARKAYLPGMLLAAAAALAAGGLVSALKLEVVGASVLALVLGMAISAARRPGPLTTPGIRLTAKKALKAAIILLGASLDLSTILTVGRMTLTVLLFTLTVCFAGGFLLGKLLGLDWKLTALISSGTAICGGTAIASVAPAIRAKDSDIAYALSTIFLFDVLLVILLPLFGRALDMPDIAFGLWSGTSIHDTSSVVAAGYAFSEAAGDFSAMVKLTRTLCMIPTVLFFSVLGLRGEKPAGSADWKSLFPWFILAFLGMTALRSAGIIPDAAAALMKSLSRFLFVTALAAVGLHTNLSDLRQSGLRPLLLGFLLSVLVLATAFSATYLLGLQG